MKFCRYFHNFPLFLVSIALLDKLFNVTFNFMSEKFFPSFLLICISFPRYEAFICVFESLLIPTRISCIILCSLLSFFRRNNQTCIFVNQTATKRTKRLTKFLRIFYLPLSLVNSSEQEFSSQYFLITLKPFLISETVDLNYDAVTSEFSKQEFSKSEILLGGIILPGEGNLKRKDLTIRTFFQAKNSFM